MASIDQESSVVLHQLSNAVVRSGKCPEESLTQASAGGRKVKSEALEKVDTPPVLKVSVIYIKEEPEDGTEEVSIKEEPFLYGNEACSTVHLRPAPALSLCGPCKMEAQIEAHDAHPNSSQNISALLLNQFGEGGSTQELGEAAGSAYVSGAFSSKQHIRLGCSQRGLMPAGAGQLQQLIDLEQPALGPHHCSEYTSSSGSGLQQHINAMHSIEASFKSSDHEQLCTMSKSVQSHFKSKILPRSKLRCKFCSFLCATEDDLEQHTLLRHPQGSAQKYSRSEYADKCKEIKHNLCHSKHSSMKNFCCSECDYACTIKMDLKTHFLRRHSTEKSHQCSECDYACTTKSNLKSHMLFKHSTEKPFQCSKCDYACTTNRNLKTHFLRKHSREKPIQCTVCDYACITKGELKRHFLFKHSTEKPFQCTECDYACTIKRDLETHFIFKHSTEKPNQCSECDYACSTKGNLKSHFLHKHSTDKPIQCSECDYACSTKGALKSHFLRKHSTEKPHQCSECDYACTTKWDLKTHFFCKHSTEKPFQCSECEYAFITKGNLKRHLIQKHSTEKLPSMLQV